MSSFAYNPFTDNLDYKRGTGGAAGIASITGNVGGPVESDGTGNIDVVGVGGVLITGIPLSNRLEVSIAGSGFT